MRLPLFVARFAFHITCVCRLHVWFAFVVWDCLCVYACFRVRVCLLLPLYVATLRFKLHVCILHDCIAIAFWGHISYACMLVLLAAWLRVHLFVATLRFIVHVCRLHVGFAFVPLACPIVLV